MTKDYFQHNILALRKAKGWSQEKLAEAAGVSLHTVFRAEAGSIPRGANIEKIADALGVSQADLFADPRIAKQRELNQSQERLRLELNERIRESEENTRRLLADYKASLKERTRDEYKEELSRELSKEFAARLKQKLEEHLAQQQTHAAELERLQALENHIITTGGPALLDYLRTMDARAALRLCRGVDLPEPGQPSLSSKPQPSQSSQRQAATATRPTAQTYRAKKPAG